MMSSTASLPVPAKMRLTRELSLFSQSPPPGISCYTPNDTLTHLHAQIAGPPDSPFEKGSFLLVINIPLRYPFEPPRIRFLTPIHHPNIDSQGRICLDSLKSQPNGSWSPAISLPSLLLQIRTLMGEPNAEDGLVADVTEQYKVCYDEWFHVAKEMTLKEATEDKLVYVEQEYLKSIQPVNQNDGGGGRRRNRNFNRRSIENNGSGGATDFTLDRRIRSGVADANISTCSSSNNSQTGTLRKISKLKRSTLFDKENQKDSNSMDTTMDDEDEVVHSRLSGNKRKDIAQDESSYASSNSSSARKLMHR